MAILCDYLAFLQRLISLDLTFLIYLTLEISNTLATNSHHHNGKMVANSWELVEFLNFAKYCLRGLLFAPNTVTTW